MLFKLGLALLFFLPIIESINRTAAYYLLLIGSILISLHLIKKRIHLDKVELLWLATLLVFLITTFTSWSMVTSLTEFCRYLAYFLIFICIRRLDPQKKFIIRYILWMLIINSIILSFISLFYLLQPIAASGLSDGMNLFYAKFGHNHLSDILIFAVPVLIFQTIITSHKIQKFIFILLSSFIMLMLFLTVSRGAILSLSLAFFIFIIIIKSRQLNVWAILLGSLTILFLASSFLYSNFLVGKIGYLDKPFKFYKPVYKENRLEYISQAWEGFSKSPLLGTGLDTFRYVSKIYNRPSGAYSWYVHNHFLQIFLETGILGGLLFICLVICLAFYSYKNISYKNYNDYKSGFFIAVLTSGIHSLIDFDWQFISVFLLLWIFFAILTPQSGLNVRKKSMPLYFFILICFFLFLSQIFLPLVENKMSSKADELTRTNKINEAILWSKRAYWLDKMDQRTIAIIAGLYAANQNYNQAHLWYRKGINLQLPLTEELKRREAMLYLVQAYMSLDHKDYAQSFAYVKAINGMYSYIKDVDMKQLLREIESDFQNNKLSEIGNMIHVYLDAVKGFY